MHWNQHFKFWLEPDEKSGQDQNLNYLQLYVSFSMPDILKRESKSRRRQWCDLMFKYLVNVHQSTNIMFSWLMDIGIF